MTSAMMGQVLYAKEVLKALRLRKKVRHQDDSVIPAKHIDAYWDEEAV